MSDNELPVPPAWCAFCDGTLMVYFFGGSSALTKKQHNILKATTARKCPVAGGTAESHRVWGDSDLYLCRCHSLLAVIPLSRSCRSSCRSWRGHANVMFACWRCTTPLLWLAAECDLLANGCPNLFADLLLEGVSSSSSSSRTMMRRICSAWFWG